MKLKLMNKLMWMTLLVISLSGCQCRTPDEILDDTCTARRHVNKGFRALGGKNGDSRMVCSREEFFYVEDDSCNMTLGTDFIPLSDQQNSAGFNMSNSQQPKESPGDPGSSIPGIDAFKDPHSIPGLAGIFQNINFDYNSNLVKGQDNMATIHKIADYMRTHPGTYVFVEGHTDERGPEAYNLSLGARRSNAVRDMLIKEGVSPNNLFTVSYGKERPLVYEHHDEAWAQNRRVEFKIYQR